MADKKVGPWVKRIPGPGWIDTDPFGDSSLLHLFKFDGDLTDSVGTADLNVNSGSVSYVQGKKGQAEGGYPVVLRTSSGVFLVPNITFTISVWLRGHNNMSLADNTGIVIQGPDSGYGCWFGRKANEYTLQISNGNASAVALGSNIVENEWHHYIVSSDGSNGAKAYYDGQWVKDLGVLNSNGDTNNNINSTSIKSYYNIAVNDDFESDIDIDHLRIFNRALTAQEVQTLYNNGG